MIFPLEDLSKYKGGMYAITVAASRRAYQMARVNDPYIAENHGKDVCSAARQLFTKKVKYRIENKD